MTDARPEDTFSGGIPPPENEAPTRADGSAGADSGDAICSSHHIAGDAQAEVGKHFAVIAVRLDGRRVLFARYESRTEAQRVASDLWRFQMGTEVVADDDSLPASPGTTITPVPCAQS